MDFNVFLDIPPYSVKSVEKKKLLTGRLSYLSSFHRDNCFEYENIIKLIGENEAASYEELPFLPVRLFKELSLKSVTDDEIVKTMTSSGTTGQKTSKIFLDRTTASNQQKAMVKIVSDFTGASRMPMIIIDCPSVLKNRAMFSARGAGILGFSIFGSKKIYALDDDMNLDVDGITAFLDDHKGEKILLFGFTFMIWQHFYKELISLKEKGIIFDLSNAVMIHGGGWKKLVSEAVSPKEFHDRMKAACGLDHIHDYYGMVEQTGCIYMQCECGHLHASIFSDIITRRHTDFSLCEIGEPGIIQVVSTIPESYPGHSLLTEDEGVILGEDDCPCGRKGKYFKVLGRLKNAEIRGCSDTYASGFISKDINNDSYALDVSVLKRVTCLVGNIINIDDATKIETKKAFDEDVLEFCNTLSKEFITSKEARLYPDIVTLGFWLRKASLSKYKEQFTGNYDDILMIGRGVAFHIAPSNVPVNFAYSLFAGLITGNVNIVRIPSKEFPQVTIICNIINTILEKYENIKPYITLIRYERDVEVNNYISSLCDVRVVWGGDNTIREIRKSDLGPRTTEITFADRYSLALIDANEYINYSDKDRIASDFYNDTYLSDQNACTSPRVVIWIGNADTVRRAKEKFWKELHEIVKDKYNLQPVQSVEKLSQKYISAVKCKENGLSDVAMEDNFITRIKVNTLTASLMEQRGNSGFFYEYDMKDVMELRDICNNTHCQTIGIIGNKDILMPLIKSGVKGIDRVVPIGHTMDFDLIWDGYNLVERLTRTIKY